MRNVENGRQDSGLLLPPSALHRPVLHTSSSAGPEGMLGPSAEGARLGQGWWRLLELQLFHWPLHSGVMMMDSSVQGCGLATLHDL